MIQLLLKRIRVIKYISSHKFDIASPGSSRAININYIQNKVSLYESNNYKCEIKLAIYIIIIRFELF